MAAELLIQDGATGSDWMDPAAIAALSVLVGKDEDEDEMEGDDEGFFEDDDEVEGDDYEDDEDIFEDDELEEEEEFDDEEDDEL